MSNPADYSSELQRKFAEASAQPDREAMEAYLRRECADDYQQLQWLRQLLAATGAAGKGRLAEFKDQLRDVADTVNHCEETEEIRPDPATDFPQVDRHQVLGVLGEGAMGTVYLAQQTDPIRRMVALKVIKPGMDSRQVLARFDREKQTLAALEHNHICKVFDAGMTHGGYPYFSMELVNGLPIDQYCASNQLSVQDRLCLMIDVCSAVQHAHERGIIHRDLKPSNILVALTDKKPSVKVIDFGVAKAMASDPNEASYETYFRQLIGTPMYMSPEQLDPSKQSVDARSDVYALGGVLFHLLTGAAPLEPSTENHGSTRKVRCGCGACPR